MKTIWKFPLEITDEQTIQIPWAANALCVQTQDGAPTLWCEVMSGAEMVDWKVFCFGTGNPMPDTDNLIYIDTVQTGPLVWHYYYEKVNRS